MPPGSTAPETPYRWRIDPHGAMRVPGIVFASRALLPTMHGDRSLQQVADVATLPGHHRRPRTRCPTCMGLRLPDRRRRGDRCPGRRVVSRRGRFDISCGVPAVRVVPIGPELRPPGSKPDGTRSTRAFRAAARPAAVCAPVRHPRTGSTADEGRVTVGQGHGVARDLRPLRRRWRGRDAEVGRAVRGAMGTRTRPGRRLGSGNHSSRCRWSTRSSTRTPPPGSGSRPGSVRDDPLRLARARSPDLPDHVRQHAPGQWQRTARRARPQLACAPVYSPKAGLPRGPWLRPRTFGRANRQLLTEAARAAFREVLGPGPLDLLYDVSHNLAKMERHPVDGTDRLLCVHRKGATRALAPGHPICRPTLRATGQPVLVPGSMGTASHLLAASRRRRVPLRVPRRRPGDEPTRGDPAGPRQRPARTTRGAGIAVRASSMRGLAEEAPFSYKDVDDVVEVCEHAGLARRVARLRPIGVVKG